MAESTYSARAIVLRRTRLKETDLIITALSSDGRQIRAVAKGARRPSSVFAARLELYTEVDLLCARGRGDLDIVKEARIVAVHAGDMSPEFSVMAAVVAEAAEKLTHVEVASPKICALTRAVFDRLDALASCGGLRDEWNRATAMLAAYLLKAFAFTGFRPTFAQCAVCGSEVDLRAESDALFSVIDGGVVCRECRLEASSVHAVPAPMIVWADYLLHSPFDAICADYPELAVSHGVLRICRDWMNVHAGIRLKSLNSLLEARVPA